MATRSYSGQEGVPPVPVQGPRKALGRRRRQMRGEARGEVGPFRCGLARVVRVAVF